LEEARDYSANWMAYLAADGWGNSWVLTLALKLTGARWSEVLFPGILTVALSVIGIRAAVAAKSAPDTEDVPRHPRSRETALFYGLVGCLAVWLSAGPGAGFYSVMYRFAPTFSLLRAPARFGIVVTLALVVLAALGVAHLLRGRRRAAVLAAAACLVAAAELIPVPLPYHEVPRAPVPYVMLAHLPDGPVAEFPFFYREVDFHRHAAYMLNSTAHWKPLVNGYSDYLPADFRKMVIPVSSFPALQAFNILRQHRPRYVLFHADWYDGRSREQLEHRLKQYAPYLRKLASEGDLWLYEIVGWPDEEPS
jgi:hypothetical protein